MNLSLPTLQLTLQTRDEFVTAYHTLRTSLSGAFLRTLSEFVTALFISAQLSTNAASALRKVWVLI